jgi:hypothetical protein
MEEYGGGWKEIVEQQRGPTGQESFLKSRVYIKPNSKARKPLPKKS